MKRDWTSRGTLLLVVLILAVVNVIGIKFFQRVDLTDENVYTLTDASRSLVAGLDDPVTITAYFTRNLPAPYGTNRRFLADKLEEYKAYGGANLQYAMIDPGDDEKVREDLNRFGIPSVQIQVIESDNLQLKNAYMGVVIRYEGEREIIPVVQDLSSLEYDISSAIMRLTSDRLPEVAFLQSHGEPEPSQDMATLVQQLQRNYQVLPITPRDSTLSGNADVLMIVAPTDTLSVGHARAIDDYIMSGGRVGLLLNRVQADLQSGQASPAGTGLEDMLSAYGIGLRPNLVMDEQSSAITIQRRQGFFNVAQQVPYPFFPAVTRFHPENMMVSRLRDAVFYFASSVDTTLMLPDGVTYEPLALSSSRSDAQEGFFFIQPQVDQRPQFSAGPFVLGAAYSGSFPSAFRDGVTSPPTRIVLFGDGDFVNESVVGAIPGNIRLVLNMVDWLAQDEALLGIRSRSVQPRVLRDVSEAARPWIKYLNMLGPTLLVILFGMFWWRRQRARAESFRSIGGDGTTGGSPADGPTAGSGGSKAPEPTFESDALSPRS